MSWMWLEAALPLGIIAGMISVMGNAQYYIHKAAHGRPKHIGDDICGMWPWREETTSSWTIFLPLHPISFFSMVPYLSIRMWLAYGTYWRLS
ncbi:hypothetical protein MANES_08G168000v8 [Manihot esculenta]|uniref:NADH dehydrogenase [ubiquinone] 1 alpha subcomplex subunit 1 n=2 Tax=Manihot esculenta TaxID=3983 RepID=A0A2C9VJ00_MANES|nr:hypothetical protein MANES_08G168000v8 [Manihot esculenta]OAY44643.1 hypothetical protein MANES_08G168000v8 [Manihot esculenta]